MSRGFRGNFCRDWHSTCTSAKMFGKEIKTMTYAVALPNPAVGSLESYIQAVRAFPILTPEEETEYARRLRDENDVDAASKLVLSHLRVVVHIARGYMGYGLPTADLI